MSYILPLCKGYLPGKGYVIYSPGTARRTTYIKLFVFRYSIVMQEKIAFNQCERPFFFLIKRFFFKLPGAGSLVSLPERSRRTQTYGLAIFLIDGSSKLWAKCISKADAQLKRRRYAQSQVPFAPFQSFPPPASTLPPPPPPESSGTLRSEDGEGSENVSEKVNSRSFNLHRDYFKSLTLSNVGEPS